MQFAQVMAILECPFIKYSQEILGVNILIPSHLLIL
jgi:hypothetical protein